MASLGDKRKAMTFEEVVDALKSEHVYQLRKWGYRQPDGKMVEGQHTVSDFLTYMGDYLLEANHEATRKPGAEAALASLRKVVMLGLVCFMQNGIPFRDPSVEVINARDGLPA